MELTPILPHEPLRPTVPKAFSCKSIQKGPGVIRPDLSLSAYFGPNSDNRIPAAIAEPMTPATFGPMACMSRKFLGLSF